MGLTEWSWWDWSFALKLLWHGFVFGMIGAAFTSVVAFRWAWRRGVQLDKIKQEVEERAKKLAEKREERIH